MNVRRSLSSTVGFRGGGLFESRTSEKSASATSSPRRAPLTRHRAATSVPAVGKRQAAGGRASNADRSRGASPHPDAEDRDAVALTQRSRVGKLHQAAREQIVGDQAQRRREARRRATSPSAAARFNAAAASRWRSEPLPAHRLRLPRLALFDRAERLDLLTEVARQPCFGGDASATSANDSAEEGWNQPECLRASSTA